jgi:hypothetical protein
MVFHEMGIFDITKWLRVVINWSIILYIYSCHLGSHDAALFVDPADETCQLPNACWILEETKLDKKVETRLPPWGKDIQRLDDVVKLAAGATKVSDSEPEASTSTSNGGTSSAIDDLKQLNGYSPSMDPIPNYPSFVHLAWPIDSEWPLPTAPQGNIISSELEDTTGTISMDEVPREDASDPATDEQLVAHPGEPHGVATERELQKTLGCAVDGRCDCHTGAFTPTVSPLQSSDFAHLHVARRESPKPKTYHCTFCDVQFGRKGDWVRHETNFHEPQRRWQCPDCSARFYSETSFVRHHRHNHSCAKCVHANEAKVELPRKTAWGCGFCGKVWRDWKERCDHVAAHFASGKTKEEWDFSKVISGLLKQDWIIAAWERLIVQRHGDDSQMWPNFRWNSTSDGCLELLQDLEHGHCDQADIGTFVETAYCLGLPQMRDVDSANGLFPTDSESM